MPDILHAAQGYGLVGFAVLGGLAVLIWIGAHVVAEPGEKVSLLFGLATYTKKKRIVRPPKPAAVGPAPKPIEIIDETLDLMWRVQVSVALWIDDDLTKLSDTDLDSILSGPYHLTCKRDLGRYNSTLREWQI